MVRERAEVCANRLAWAVDEVWKGTAVPVSDPEKKEHASRPPLGERAPAAYRPPIGAEFRLLVERRAWSGRLLGIYASVGAVSITAGLVLVIFGVTRGGRAARLDAGTFGALALVLALLVGFFLQEACTRDLLLRLNLLASPHPCTGTPAAFIFSFIVNELLFFAPLHKQGMLGCSPFRSRLDVLPVAWWSSCPASSHRRSWRARGNGSCSSAG
ncbi:hypothetical protein [Streptomyces sp. NPDC093707]|uniref:hypothetical protein n=1 Tax=Streptomyces sp. NPDC093707 TaxID=3154984 RepID=UPI00344FD1A1